MSGAVRPRQSKRIGLWSKTRHQRFTPIGLVPRDQKKARRFRDCRESYPRTILSMMSAKFVLSHRFVSTIAQAYRSISHR